MEFTSRQLRAFHLVAEHSSFARAAEALFVTPSGLSVTIRELETQLGCRLFDRTTRRVGLTAYGRDFLASTRPALREVDGAAARIDAVRKGKEQSISIGATPWLAANVLPEAIKRFRAKQPVTRIELYDGALKAVLRRVEIGKLDMGLGLFPSAPGVRRVPFFRFSLMVIRPATGAATQRAKTPWSALKGQLLISLTSNYAHQKLIDQHLAKAGVAADQARVVNLLDTQIGLVEAEEGIAIIPSFALPACRTRRVMMSQLVNPVVDLDLHQISHRGKKLPPVALEFGEFLKSYIAEWAGHAGAL